MKLQDNVYFDNVVYSKTETNSSVLYEIGKKYRYDFGKIKEYYYLRYGLFKTCDYHYPMIGLYWEQVDKDTDEPTGMVVPFNVLQDIDCQLKETEHE